MGPSHDARQDARSARPDGGRAALWADDERGNPGVNRERLDQSKTENEWRHDLSGRVGVSGDTLERCGRGAPLAHTATERSNADRETGRECPSGNLGGRSLRDDRLRDGILRERSCG